MPTGPSPGLSENVDKTRVVREESGMQRILQTAMLLALAFSLSSCGIINHQLHRASNLLRIPVRVSQSTQSLPQLDGVDHSVRFVA